ncbi:MAG: RnfABCDGE type electron transport complex subunit G [Candidatus Omnitrophota bacterium]|nr:RnfABCDGE type electron transport complex subunit G [Candidatus Omnitrophota bacterium]MBU1894630.1 RnfABCDGE type electron transport complex subunit G [Candidatus Omnitrophota bacterium]
MAKNKITSIVQNSGFKIIFSLAIVGILSGAVLVFVYNYAMPKIKINVKSETEKAIKDIFPKVNKIENMKDEVFQVMDEQDKLLGYAFIAEGNGYQGTIKMIIGVDTGISKIVGMEVLESQETPGLGAEIAEQNFRKQFEGLSITQDIEYVKNQKPQKPNQVEAITGATISSRAVVNIINKTVTAARKEIKG